MGTRIENEGKPPHDDASLKSFRYTEVTRAIVTTVRTIKAESMEAAQDKFDQGDWDTMVENVGDVVSEISSDIEQVDDEPSSPSPDF